MTALQLRAINPFQRKKGGRRLGTPPHVPNEAKPWREWRIRLSTSSEIGTPHRLADSKVRVIATQ
jgi:hypothetical protein